MRIVSRCVQSSVTRSSLSSGGSARRSAAALVGVAVRDPAEEDRGRTGGAAGESALAIGFDPLEMDMRVKLLAEALRLESDLVCVAFEVSAPERVLAAEQTIVHRPEASLRVQPPRSPPPPPGRGDESRRAESGGRRIGTGLPQPPDPWMLR